MNDDDTREQKALMARWLVMSDVALKDSQSESVSEPTRCSAAFDAGYVFVSCTCLDPTPCSSPRSIRARMSFAALRRSGPPTWDLGCCLFRAPSGTLLRCRA